MPTPQQTDALGRLGTETAFEVLARARALEAQGRTILHLEIGEPGVDTAPHIVEAAAKALRDGHTRYCPAAGLPELREAVAAYMSRTRGTTVSPDRVVVAPGAKPFLLFSVLATCNPGDEVVYPDPGFPIYESVIRFAGATPVPLPLTEERGFAFAASDLADRLSPRTRLVILNSPGNPTGGVIDRALNAELAEALRPHDCYVLADEVYSEILYGERHDSLTSHEGLDERVILLESASKTFSMTGWRLGYAALPAALVEPMVRLAINTHSCVAPATQLAGVAAAARPARRRPQRPAGRALRAAEGGVLRVPERLGDGDRCERARRSPAAGGRRGAARGERVRRARARVPAAVDRGLAGDDRGCAGRDAGAVGTGLTPENPRPRHAMSLPP
jgi:aspartate/methionine/tyrosine aminotransferase